MPKSDKLKTVAAKVTKPKKAKTAKPAKEAAVASKAAKIEKTKKSKKAGKGKKGAKTFQPIVMTERAKLLSSKVVYEGPLFRILHDKLIEPGGHHPKAKRR